MNSADPQPQDERAFLSGEMAQYLQVYIDESDEELDGLTEAILQLEKNPRHSDSLNRAFRMLHSLKGSSGMLGFETVGELAHELEERFEEYRSGHDTLNRETTTLILQAVDFFREFLNRLRAGNLAQGDPASLLWKIRESRDKPRSKPTSAGTNATDQRGDLSISQTGGFRLHIRFRQGLQLADLKARLILSKLSAIGEIVSCDPTVDDIDSFEELTLFSLTLITAKSIDEVRKIASVDGVESIDIHSSSLSGDTLHAVPVSPTTRAADAAAEKLPADSETLSSQPNLPHALGSAAASSPAAAPARSMAATIETSALVPSAESSESETQNSVISQNDAARDVRSAVQETLRVDIGRLDQLLNLTGELVVANARCNQLLTDIQPVYRRSPGQRRSADIREDLRNRFERLRVWLHNQPDGARACNELLGGLDEELNLLDRESALHESGRHFYTEIADAIDQLNRVSRNMQRSVLSTRMIPVGPLFNRFRRVVRDLSVDRGKQVRLLIQGEKTELDKRMIDALGDPLLHLIRNSLDHGMESPDVRRAAGKAEAGTIILSAVHRGNNVMITIQDDGGGIQTNRIRSKLVAQGLATAAQAESMSEQQVIETIWQPGFSTASAVTEISGRGVGMDIVRAAISDLSGTIEVATSLGQGTTFTIRLPQTLAIIHSLLFRCGSSFFAVPIDDVREIVSVTPLQIHSIHRHQAIEVRGELVPMFELDDVFRWHGPGLANSGSDAECPEARRQEVVILQARGKTLGLAVDSLIGRSNLVIKSLSENYLPVRGLSGASILGDGTVCLMLDSPAIADLTSAPRTDRDDHQRQLRRQAVRV